MKFKLTKTKIISIVVVAVIAIAAAATITVTIIKNQPKNVALRSIADTLEALREREEVSPLINVMNGGSVEVSVGKIEHEWLKSSYFGSDEKGKNTVFDGSVGGKLYLSENALMLDRLDVENGDFLLDISAYLSENLLYLKNNDDGGGAYGINFTPKISSQIENSILAYDSDSEYSLSKLFKRREYEDFLDNLDSLSSSDNKYKKFESALKELVRDLTEDTIDIIMKNVEATESIEKVRIGGERIQARVINLIADPTQISDMLSELYENILTGEKLRTFIKQNNEIITEIFLTNADETGIDARDIYINLTETLKSEISSLRNRVERSAKKFYLEIVTPKRSATLLKLSADYGVKSLFSLDLGKNGLKKTDYVSFSSGDNDDVFVYATETTKDLYTASVDVSGKNLLTFKHDKSNEKYEITLTERDGNLSSTVKINGNLKIENGVYSLSIDKCKITDERTVPQPYSKTDTYVLDLSLILKTKDKIPSAPKSYTALSEIKEHDIKKWLEKFGK